MDILFYTTGCRLNQIESESAARFFVDDNFSVSLKPLTAKSPVQDEVLLAVINTCAVTQKAEQKDRRIIRLLLEKCPKAVIVVTGCYAQLSREEILKMSPRIAVLKGLLKSRLTDLSSVLKDFIKDSGREKFDSVLFAQNLNENLFAEKGTPVKVSENSFKLSTDSFLAHSRSSIKIQDGCNCACTYCTIHIARGGSVSLGVKEVVERVRSLEKAGQSEVVFTTVNIGQYKGEYEGQYYNFTELLHLCIKETEKINFRISSLYPEIVDEYFCQVISHSRVRPYFHISVQSGSDSVLKAMARNYDSEQVLRACEMLKKYKPGVFLACDIITGFPGETDEDFEQTMELCRRCDFAWVHVFPFSERPGTPACTMKNKVTQSLRDERAKKLGKWSAENKLRYIEKCAGKTFDAVLETVKGKAFQKSGDNLIFHAVTENFLHCQISAPLDYDYPEQGSQVKVKIIGPIPDSTTKGGETDCLAQFAE